MSDVVAAALLLILAALLIFTWYRCHVRLRAKGYGRFVTFVLLLLSVILTVWLLSRIDNDIFRVLGIPVLWMLFGAGLARALPARAGGRAALLAPRRAGRRGALMPKTLGWLATVVGSAISLFFLWQLVSPTIVPRDEGWPALLAIIAMTVAVSQYWFRIANRATAAPVALQPTETAVLYLRAFEEEQKPFAVGPRSVLKRYTSQFAANAPLTRGDPTIKLTLEDFLEEAITAQFGQFVALGNPHDRLNPDGAVREYAPDDAWQQRFLDLARSAKCIVVSVGGSANLQWELEQIRQHGYAQKLCLFTSPRLPGSEPGIIGRLRRTQQKRDRQLKEAWATSTEALRRAGYECEAVCPGTGAAVTFDEQGKSMVITADATSPAEFMTPVGDWFKSGQRTGKCVPVECASCGSITRVEPGREGNSTVCFACQTREARGRMSITEREPVLWAIVASVAAVIALVALRTDSAVVFWLTWLAVMVAPVPINLVRRAVRERSTRRQLQ